MDPVHKKIIQTEYALVNDGDFDQEESLEAAVNRRKILIKKSLNDYSFTVDSDDDEDHSNYIDISHIVLSKFLYKYRSLVLFYYVGG